MKSLIFQGLIKSIYFIQMIKNICQYTFHVTSWGSLIFKDKLLEQWFLVSDFNILLLLILGYISTGKYYNHLGLKGHFRIQIKIPLLNPVYCVGLIMWNFLWVLLINQVKYMFYSAFFNDE